MHDFELCAHLIIKMHIAPIGHTSRCPSYGLLGKLRENKPPVGSVILL